VRIFPAILSIFTLTVNCSAQEPKQAKAIEVQAGQNFTITLEANATTGYQWQFAKPLDESAIQLISSEYLADKTRLVGAGGKQVWIFKALKEGRVNLLKSLWRKEDICQL